VRVSVGARVHLPTWQRCIPGQVRAPTMRPAMYCGGSTPCCPHRSISTPARLEHPHSPLAPRGSPAPHEKLARLQRAATTRDTFHACALGPHVPLAEGRQSSRTHAGAAGASTCISLCISANKSFTNMSLLMSSAWSATACTRPNRACARAHGCVCAPRYSSGQAELCVASGEKRALLSRARAEDPGRRARRLLQATKPLSRRTERTRSTRALAVPQQRWAAVEQQRRNTAGFRGRFWAGGAIDSLLLVCCGCLECSRSRLAERGSELSAWCLIVNSLMLLPLIDTIWC